MKAEITTTVEIEDSWFYQGFALINVNSLWNYIDKQGVILSRQWFNHANDFNKYGCAVVEVNDKWNIIDTKGSILSELWFDFVWNFFDGWAKVAIPDKGYNYINSKGELLSDKWFIFANGFVDGCAYANDKNGIYHIDINGQMKKVAK